jgi:hypothetical protein
VAPAVIFSALADVMVKLEADTVTAIGIVALKLPLVAFTERLYFVAAILIAVPI